MLGYGPLLLSLLVSNFWIVVLIMLFSPGVDFGLLEVYYVWLYHSQVMCSRFLICSCWIAVHTCLPFVQLVSMACFRLVLVVVM